MRFDDRGRPLLQQLGELCLEMAIRIRGADRGPTHPGNVIRDLLPQAQELAASAGANHFALEAGPLIRREDVERHHVRFAELSKLLGRPLADTEREIRLFTPEAAFSTSDDATACPCSSFIDRDRKGWRHAANMLAAWERFCVRAHDSIASNGPALRRYPSDFRPKSIGQRARLQTLTEKLRQAGYFDGTEDEPGPHYSALLQLLRRFSGTPDEEAVFDAFHSYAPSAADLQAIDQAASKEGLSRREFLAREARTEVEWFIRKNGIPDYGAPLRIETAADASNPVRQHDGATGNGIRLDGVEYQISSPRTRKLLEQICAAEGWSIRWVDASDDPNDPLKYEAAKHRQKEFNDAVAGSGWMMRLSRKFETFRITRRNES